MTWATWAAVAVTHSLACWLGWYLSDRRYDRGARTLTPGEPPELASLPAEVVGLVHAVDRMRDHWAEADSEAQRYLWTSVHQASDAVWGRLDDGRPSA